MRRHLLTDHQETSYRSAPLGEVQQEQERQAQTQSQFAMQVAETQQRQRASLRTGDLINARKIRSSYLRTWASLGFGVYAFGMIVLHLMWLFGTLDGPYLESVRSWQPFLLVGMLIELALAAPIGASMHSAIGAEGLETTTIWGWRRALRWSEMTSARRARMLGIPYLRIGAEKGLALWLPLIPADKAAFVTALNDYAPTNHPVRQALHLD